MATDAAPNPVLAGTPPSSPLAAATPDPRRKLSEELDLILREFEVETVTLREVMEGGQTISEGIALQMRCQLEKFAPTK